MTRQKVTVQMWTVLCVAALLLCFSKSANSAKRQIDTSDDGPNQVLEWNQIPIDTLIVTNTANS